jgi:uncharacterized protein
MAFVPGSRPMPFRPWPSLAVLLVAAGALSGCASTAVIEEGTGATPPASARLPPEAWMGQLREAKYDGVVSASTAITAADGTRLSLTYHLPRGLESGAQVPTLLEITPYQSFVLPERSTPVTGTDGPFASEAAFVRRGFAYVEADARGTNGSGGCLDFGGALDRSDAAAFAAWVRAQPWSNGVIVTDGVSHPGMGSVVAHTAIPGLAGALAHAPVVSYYRDEWYQGAKFEDQFNGPLYEAVEAGPPLHSDPGSILAQAAACRGKTTLDYSAPEGAFTPFWADRDLSRHLSNETRPILLTHGFVDQNVHPDHAQIYWDALPDDYPKHAIFGWWYHGYPDLDGHPAEDFDAVRQRWIEALAFGPDAAFLAEPRVLVEDSEGTWHEGDQWPLEPSVWVTLNATADGGLAAAPAAPGGLAYADDPRARRGTWQDAHVAFRTGPLASDMLVNGAPTVRLQASSMEAETKWAVYLMAEAPDGSWQRISHGYADSHTWGPEGTWQAMVPGTAYTWEVQLMPTAVVVPAGSRITLVVASEDSRQKETAFLLDRATCFDDHRDGCYDPSGILPAASAGRAVNTVRTGPDATSVRLAWVDPGATAKVPWD